MSAPFLIADYDLQQIGASGNGSVPIKVAGYWSYDPIRLYIRREWNFKIGDESSFAWRAELSHSSGGRETDPAKGGIKDDLEAETNFGAALIAIAAIGRAIMAQVATLEAAYQAQSKIAAAERAEAEEARKARLEADPAIGEVAVEHKIDVALAHLKGPDSPTVCQYVLTFLPRGQKQDRYNVYSLVVAWNGHTKRATFRYNGNAVTRAQAVKLTAELSGRAVETLS